MCSKQQGSNNESPPLLTFPDCALSNAAVDTALAVLRVGNSKVSRSGNGKGFTTELGLEGNREEWREIGTILKSIT